LSRIPSILSDHDQTKHDLNKHDHKNPGSTRAFAPGE
jgi:hypothetical protein